MEMASSTIIMMDIIVYCVVSVIVMVALDYYAAKKLGGRQSPTYKMMNVERKVCIFILAVFTLVIGLLCLMRDLTVSRYTLTYFGLPYFIPVAYYLVRVIRITRSQNRHL